VSRLELSAFDASHLADAGRLLAARHAGHRRHQPLLSARFEEPDAATVEVEAALRRAGASGAVALQDGRAVGFVLGAPKDDPVWGPNLWVESAGQALAPDTDRETIRDLYALAAARWYDEGRTAHYVVVPSYDAPLLEAWWRLGFGQQHAHAVRDLSAEPATVPDGLVVRRAERRDISILARLEVSLPQHQSTSPTFSAGRPGSVEESQAEWEEDFDDDGYATYVAERQGVVVGSAVGCALELSGSNTALIRPEGAGFLGFAAVLPEHRGSGAGRALGAAVMQWCREQDMSCVATDWRVTNLLSSRSWTALGFRPTFLRLHRLLGF
jgi:GNAT superfamily N-acetyltransferase